MQTKEDVNSKVTLQEDFGKINEETRKNLEFYFEKETDVISAFQTYLNEKKLGSKPKSEIDSLKTNWENKKNDLNLFVQVHKLNSLILKFDLGRKAGAENFKKMLVDSQAKEKKDVNLELEKDIYNLAWKMPYMSQEDAILAIAKITDKVQNPDFVMRKLQEEVEGIYKISEKQTETRKGIKGIFKKFKDSINSVKSVFSFNRKKMMKATAFSLLGALAPLFAQAQDLNQNSIYEVQKGDNGAWSVAHKMGIGGKNWKKLVCINKDGTQTPITQMKMKNGSPIIKIGDKFIVVNEKVDGKKELQPRKTKVQKWKGEKPVLQDRVIADADVSYANLENFNLDDLTKYSKEEKGKSHKVVKPKKDITKNLNENEVEIVWDNESQKWISKKEAEIRKQLDLKIALEQEQGVTVGGVMEKGERLKGRTHIQIKYIVDNLKHYNQSRGEEFGLLGYQKKALKEAFGFNAEHSLRQITYAKKEHLMNILNSLELNRMEKECIFTGNVTPFNQLKLGPIALGASFEVKDGELEASVKAMLDFILKDGKAGVRLETEFGTDVRKIMSTLAFELENDWINQVKLSGEYSQEKKSYSFSNGTKKTDWFTMYGGGFELKHKGKIGQMQETMEKVNSGEWSIVEINPLYGMYGKVEGKDYGVLEKWTASEGNQFVEYLRRYGVAGGSELEAGSSFVIAYQNAKGEEKAQIKAIFGIDYLKQESEVGNDYASQTSVKTGLEGRFNLVKLQNLGVDLYAKRADYYGNDHRSFSQGGLEIAWETPYGVLSLEPNVEYRDNGQGRTKETNWGVKAMLHGMHNWLGGGKNEKNISFSKDDKKKRSYAELAEFYNNNAEYKQKEDKHKLDLTPAGGLGDFHINQILKAEERLEKEVLQTNFGLSIASVPENTVNGTIVGNVDLTVEGLSTYTIVLESQSAPNIFEIVNGNQLCVVDNTNLDHEAFSNTVLIFRITASTGESITRSATLGIGDVAETPIANNDSYVTNEDTPLTTGNVLANDSDPDGDALTVTAFDNLSTNGGVVVNNGDGTFTYTPVANWNGMDTFSYTISDGSLTDTAVVTINVNSVDDPAQFGQATIGGVNVNIFENLGGGISQVLETGSGVRTVNIPVSDIDSMNAYNVSLTGPGVLSGTTSGSIQNGIITVNYNPTAQGTATLTITDGGETRYMVIQVNDPPPDVPATINNANMGGVAVNLFDAQGQGVSQVYFLPDGVKAVTVDVTDPDSTNAYNISLTGGGSLSGTTSGTIQNGQLSFNYQPLVTGTDIITINVGGVVKVLEIQVN